MLDQALLLEADTDQQKKMGVLLTAAKEVMQLDTQTDLSAVAKGT